MRRLFVVYGTALTSAVLLALLVPLALLASSLAHDRALTAARQEAQGLNVIATTAGRNQLSDAVDAVNTGERRTTVFLPDGTVIGAAAPRTPSVELASRGAAFTAETKGGEEILLPVGGPEGVVVIRTFVPAEQLRAGVGAAWTMLAMTGAVLLATAVLIGSLVARRLSRSVRVLADVAARVGAGDLTATVTPAGPAEVASVGRVLNGLGARISQMLAHEREMSADLSHRLRTPVTALRLDVESLADPTERERMTAHVDQLVAAVDAAVSEVRKPAQARRPGSCDAVQVVTARARFWSVLADDTGRSMAVDVPDGPLPVCVPADDLGASLDALIDNVFSHTSPGTSFGLRVQAMPDSTVHITVEDEGQGLESEGLAERGRSGGGSTGIGLDVARRTALMGGGSVVVGCGAAGGARIVMTFPRARALAES
jgi:signal transduction histidine kinase